MKEVIQVFKIRDNFFFCRGMHLPTKTLVLLSIFFYLFHFVSCTLFLIFTLSDFCVPIKHGFLNVFPFSADMNCLYLNTFYSVLTLLYFQTTTNFDSFVFIIIMIIFIIIVVIIIFVIAIAIIIASFSMPNIFQSWQ